MYVEPKECNHKTNCTFPAKEFAYINTLVCLVQSNLEKRNFLVTLKLFLNAKCSISLWSKTANWPWEMVPYHQFGSYQIVPYHQVWLYITISSKYWIRISTYNFSPFQFLKDEQLAKFFEGKQNLLVLSNNTFYYLSLDIFSSSGSLFTWFLLVLLVLGSNFFHQELLFLVESLFFLFLFFFAM